MEMKSYNFKCAIMIIITFLTVSACTSPDLDCEGTNGDILKVVDQQLHGETNYFLARRISGFQDKVISLELYDIAPNFDECSKSQYSPIFANSADYDDRPITGLKVNEINQTFEIIYGAVGEKEGIIKLVFK